GPKRRHQADQEREADALDEGHEDPVPALTGPRPGPAIGSKERRSLARGDDPAPVLVSSCLRQQLHLPLEILHAFHERTLSATQGEEEGGPYYAQGRKRQPTHAPGPSFAVSPARHNIWIAGRR